MGNTLGEYRPTFEVAGRISYRLTDHFSLGLRAEWKNIVHWREMPNDVTDAFGNKLRTGLNITYNKGQFGLGAFVAPGRTSLNLSRRF